MQLRLFSVILLMKTELYCRTLVRYSRAPLMIARATAFRVATASHTNKRSRLTTAISICTKATISNWSSSTSSPTKPETIRQKTQSRYVETKSEECVSLYAFLGFYIRQCIFQDVLVKNE